MSALVAFCCIVSWFGTSSILTVTPYGNQPHAQQDILPQFDIDSLVSHEEHNSNADLGEQVFDQRRRYQSLLLADNLADNTLPDYTSPTTVMSTVPWSGVENAEWCQAPSEPPLNYEECKWKTWVFKFGVHGGLTNALHFILKGAYYLFLFFEFLFACVVCLVSAVQLSSFRSVPILCSLKFLCGLEMLEIRWINYYIMLYFFTNIVFLSSSQSFQKVPFGHSKKASASS